MKLTVLALLLRALLSSCTPPAFSLSSVSPIPLASPTTS